jgi:fermentation-respiration switch protein FrsA (DUF1100 family)
MAYWTKKNRIKNMIGLLLAPFVLYFVLRAFEHRQVYHPSRVMDGTPEEAGQPAEDFFFKAGNGKRLHAWFYAADPRSPRRQFVVLYCHGNAGNITSRPGYYQAILQARVNLLAFDYRGYGRSDGKPDEAGTYADTLGAVAWLKQKGFATTNIILWGESLGGGVASEVALREQVGGLVLQSSFTSIPDMGAERFPILPVRLLGRIKYDTRSKLPRINCPVLVMHSREDQIVPFAHAERNFAAAREPKLFQELKGGHNDALEGDDQAYAEGFEKFLALIAAKQPARQ